VRLRSIAGWVALLAFATGCNGAASKPANPDSDLSTARSAVLSLDDLPPGFRVTAHAPAGALSEPDKRAFAQCMHSPTTIFDAPPGATQVSSQDFANGTDEMVSGVVLAPKKSAFDPGYTQLTKPAAVSCLQQLYLDRLHGGGAPGLASVLATRFPIKGVADRATGIELTLPASANGEAATDYIDVLVGQHKRAVVTLVADGSGHPFDRTQEIELLGDVFERLRSQVN
jgi:hypothetical protein